MNGDIDPTMQRKFEEQDIQMNLQRRMEVIVADNQQYPNVTTFDQARAHPDYVAFRDKLYAGLEHRYDLRKAEERAKLELEKIRLEVEAQKSAVEAAKISTKQNINGTDLTTGLMSNKIVKWIIGALTAISILAGTVMSKVKEIRETIFGEEQNNECEGGD